MSILQPGSLHSCSGVRSQHGRCSIEIACAMRWMMINTVVENESVLTFVSQSIRKKIPSKLPENFCEGNNGRQYFGINCVDGEG